MPGVRFISLQKGPAADEPVPAGLVLHDPMPEVGDFADTAAIVAGLDLVVSVDSAVVHLAGALGKPVFLLDRYDNCWRWLSGREDSPWYPRLRIFRQERLGDWSVPMRQMAKALTVLAREDRASRLHQRYKGKTAAMTLPSESQLPRRVGISRS